MLTFKSSAPLRSCSLFKGRLQPRCWMQSQRCLLGTSFFSDRPQAGLEPTLHVALLHQSPFCKKFSKCEVPASVAGGRGDFKGEDSATKASLVLIMTLTTETERGTNLSLGTKG